jgi:hypothetical protein
MAFIGADSFDALVTADLDTSYLVGGSPVVGAYGPGGRNALRCPAGSSTLGWVMPALLGDLVMGVRCYIEDTFSSHLCAIADGQTDGGNIFLALHVNPDGSLRIQQGATNFSALGSAGTALFTSAPGVLQVGTWFTLEWKATLDASAGTLTLRLNGEQLCDLSGVVTMPGPNAGFSIAYLGCNANSVRYTDWWICDQSGDRLNDFLGDRVVEASIAETGNGHYAEFTPSTGSDHGAMVDDTTLDDDATYNGAASVNLRDTYTFPALTRVESVDAAEIVLTVRKEGTGTRAIAGLSRVGTTDTVDGTDHYLASSYAAVRVPLPVDPTTDLPWDSVAALEAAELGLKVTV